MKFYLDNWRWQGVPFTFARAKECRKNNPLLSYSSSRYHLFFWKGRHDAKPLNHKHSASNGYQATVYDKKPGLSLSLKPAEMVLIIFLALPNHLKLTKHWY
jgi:glucose-6-phosphate 1-dehydrogenase